MNELDTGEINAVVAALNIMLDPSLSFDRKLQDVLEFVVKSMNSMNGSIMILEEDELIVKTSTQPHLIGVRQKLSDDSVSIRALKNNEAVKIDDVRAAPELQKLMRRSPDDERAMFISAPITAQAQDVAVGIFNVSDKIDNQPYTAEEAKTLNRWVRRISPMVETAKLTHDVQAEKNRLKRAYSQLNKLETLKRDLVNMVVHDMKNPLQEISANLNLLESAGLDELGESYLESAVMGAEDLTRMVGNLLDISRMEEGRLQLRLEPVNVRGLLEGIAAKHRSAFEMGNIRAGVEVAGKEAPVTADQQLLERILSNLIINAVIHSPECSCVTASAVFHEERGVVEFRIADEGRGVPEEMRKRIFKKFYQLERSVGRGGSGLGLAFCHMAVKAHRGKIWVESPEGKGSVFAFEMPLDGPGGARGRKKKS